MQVSYHRTSQSDSPSFAFKVRESSVPVSDCLESVSVAVGVFFAHACVIVRANIGFGIGFSFFVGGAKYCNIMYTCTGIQYIYLYMWPEMFFLIIIFIVVQK